MCVPSGRFWTSRARSGLAALLALVAMVSCASINKPQAPEDTLLIIPVVFKAAPGSDRWIWHYELEFYGLSKPVIVMPTDRHYVAVTGIPAGRYPLTRINLVPIGSNNFTNTQTLTYPAPKMLIQTEAGTATLAPFVIDSHIEETKPNWFTQRYEIRQVLEDERRVVKDEVGAQENFSAWRDGLEQ
jgi:hypothetical protein